MRSKVTKEVMSQCVLIPKVIPVLFCESQLSALNTGWQSSLVAALSLHRGYDEQACESVQSCS